jgi:hypothetical protein
VGKQCNVTQKALPRGGTGVEMGRRPQHQENTMHTTLQHSLRLAGIAAMLAAAVPLAAVAQPGTRAGPVVGPQGVVIDSPVIVPSDTQAVSVEAAFQTADQNKDGLLSPDEVVSVPALASEFRQLDKNADGALTLQEIQTPKGPVNPSLVN